MRALSIKHEPTKWAYFEELRIGTGFGKDSEQRLDAWAIHYHPSKRNVTVCYEVKVSNSDFKKEIANPLKRRAGLRLSNEFYFVAPKDLIKIEDIPVECGLIEVTPEGKLEEAIKAPFRDVNPPTWLFLSSICRRLDKVRLGEYTEWLEYDKELQRYGNAITTALREHIDRWRNYKDGNKEVPDMIAEALEGVLADAVNIIEENRKIK